MSSTLINSHTSQADTAALADLLDRVRQPLYLLEGPDGRSIATQDPHAEASGNGRHRVVGFVPAYPLENLGDPAFCHDHGARFAYYAGAMANGIASVELVQALAGAGIPAMFGSAGLAVGDVEKAILRLLPLGEKPYGINLIHSPNETGMESAVVDLCLRHNIRLVEASAFLALSLSVVRYRTHGIHQDPSGKIVVPNRVIAKISRVEVATRFMSPPPEAMLRELVQRGDLSEAQAALAARIPVAQDITAEADSGGHTDNRPAIALLPTIIALRDRLQEQFQYDTPVRVGLGGGISTPAAAVAAFSMGAAFIVTGSVNQACVESGSCDLVRQMLAEAEQADVTMAPAADMFEMGVQLQVLKRGTLFAPRARQLYQTYKTCASLDEIPAADREKLEKTIFRAPLETIWEQTRTFFQERDPKQIERAERDPKHKMALVFRWYLGMSSRWANRGVEDRKADFQVWCGPAMGAFNEWVKGSFLQEAKAREAAVVAMNILHGAAVLMRCNSMRAQGYPVPPSMFKMIPRTVAEIEDAAKR